MILWSLIIVPIVTALLVAFGPRSSAKTVALFGSLVSLGLTIAAAAAFDWSNTAAVQLGAGPGEGVGLLPDFGVTLSVGVDSVSLWLIILTAFLQPLMVLGSYTAITENQKSFYGWLSALQAAMVGVFAAQDLLFFYFCFELTLIPMYVLISMFGSTNRKRAAVKFFLYTFTGSIVALAGFVYVAIQAEALFGAWTFAIDDLRTAAQTMSMTEQSLVLGAMLLGFGVKVPLFPLHTWLPLAHTEAPTAGSVVLAGVLLKLGTYAMYRFILPFLPDAVATYAVTIAVLAIIGIIYTGLICWVQRDVKKLIAYSSVSHLGFCVLGLFALNTIGLQGSVLYMINHGLSTGALFLCIGFMYERYHSRSMKELGGLAKKMPVWAFFLGFFTMASVGLPGLNGFVSELLCLMGAFTSGADVYGLGGTSGPLGPWFAVAAGFGMIVAAIYLLYMVGRILFGPLVEPAGHRHHGPLPVDLSVREVAVLTPLAIGCVVLGVYPKPVLNSLEAPLNDTVAIYAVDRGVGVGTASVDPVSGFGVGGVIDDGAVELSLMETGGGGR